MRLPIRSFATLLLAVGVATCADAPTVARARQAATGKGRIAISPVFSKEAQSVYAQRATNAALSFDHVRIVLVAPPADTVKDTTIVFNPASPPQTVELTVSVSTTNEVFSGEVDYTNNGAIVYQGVSKFTSYPPDQPAPAGGQELVIVYVGPGATATKLSVTPKSVTVVAPGGATFSAVATDANNATVSGVPITWSSSDPSVMTVDPNTGAASATGKRGTATITATAPTKAGTISDNGGAIVTLPPASMALVSGGGQTGKAGASLGSPAVVRVLAVDGIGVAGVTVNFAPPTGGKVGASSVTTDASGAAQTSLTLGGVAGPQSFAASAATFSVSISATATPGDPAILAAVSGGGQQDTIKHALKAPLTVRVTDAFANPVGGISVAWSVASGTGTLSAKSSTTAADGSASVGYTLGGVVGVETITASVSGIPGAANFTVSAVATGPANIAAVSGSGQTGRVQQSLAAPFVVMVTDQSGNPVSGAQVSWAASNGTMSGTTTTGPTGQASNTMTLGNVVGPASASASISNGKSVSFSAIASPGVVAQLSFRAPPPNAATGALLAPPIQVELRDASGNLTAAANPVTIALGTNPGTATLGGTLTRTSVAGVASFNDLTVSAVGNGYTLVATSAGVPPTTSAPFNVTGQAGSPFALAIASNPQTNILSGVPLTSQPSVQVVDQAGNPVPASVSVTATSTVQGGSQFNNVAATNPQTGLATFTNLALTGLGQGVIAFSSPGLQSVQSAAISVASTSLTFQVQPPTVAQNAPIPAVIVRIVNLAGALVTTANVPVTLNIASNPANGVLGGTLTATAVNGIATFSGLSINNAGIGYTLQATANGIASATSTSFDVTAQVGAPFRLAIVTSPPANNFSGVPLTQQPVIQVQDQAGNPVPASVSVTATFSAGSERNNFLPTNPATGTVGFTNLIFTGAGSGTATFSAPGLQSAQTAVSVAQTFLAFQTQPSTVTANVTMTPPVVVQIQTAAGGVIAAANGIVTTLAIATNPASGTLGGLVAVPSANGVATFSALSINNAGVAYTLQATAIGITSVTSASFDVNAQSAGVSTLWTGSVSNVWTVAGNWSSSVPTALDDVIIPAGAPNMPAITANAAARSITINSGASLTTNPITLSVGAGGISNQGTLNLNGTVLAGALDNQALTIAQGSTTITGALTTGASSILRIQGNVTFAGALLTVTNGFTNNGAIELTDLVAGYGATLVVTTGTLTNAPSGTITPLTGSNGSRGMLGQLNNQGTLTIADPQGFALTATTGAVTNSGTITVTGASFALTLSPAATTFTNTGTISIGAGARIVESGGAVDLTAGTVSGAGQLFVANGTLAFSPSTVTLPMSISNEGIVGNSITVPSGQTLNLFSSNVSAPITNNGLLLVQGSTTLQGALTTGPGSTIRIQGINTYGGASLTVTNGFTNTATIELTDAVAGYGATLAVTNGTLVNAAGGTLSILQGSNGPRSLLAELDNQSTITIANTQGLTVGRAGAASRNSGTIALTASNLTLNQTGTTPSFTNTGSVTIAAGLTWTVNGGTLDLSAGTVTGAGILAVNNATLSFSTSTIATPLTLTNTTIAGGTVTIPSGQQLELANGTMSAAVVNQGLLLIHGNVSLTGALTTGPSSITRIQGINTYGGASLTVANGFTNNATIELTDAVAGYGATLAVTTGTLVNSATGLLSILQGANGPRTIAAEIDNQNTLTISNTQGLTIGRAGARSINRGTINVTAGNLTINQTGTTPSFTSTAASTIAVTPGRTLTVNGGTFDVSAGSTTGGGVLAVNNATLAFNTTSVTTPLTLSGVTIAGGSFTIPSGQQLELVNGTFAAPLTNQGLFLVHGSVAVSAPLTTSSGGTIRIQGINTWGGGALTVASGFTNVSGSTIELTDAVAGYGATLAVTTGTLVSASGGTISILQGSNGPRTIAAELDNQGTLTIANTQGLTIGRSGAAHTNRGTIALSAGNLTVTQTGTTPTFTNTNTGSVTIAPGLTWTVSGGTLDLSAGTTTGGGILSVNSSTLAFSTATITTPLTLNNTTIAGGTVTIPSGQQLELVNGTMTAALVNQGLFLVHGGVSVTGALTTASGSTIRIQGINTYSGATLTVANSFTNVSGATIELTDAVAGYGATLRVTAGTLTNAAGGTVSILQGANGPRTIDAQLANQSTLTIGDTQGLTLFHSGASHTNSGTIAVTTGDLTLNQSGASTSFVNTGTITVPTGRNFTMAGSVGGGGTLDLSAGTTSGLGTVTASNLTLAFSTSTVTTVLTLTNVTVAGGTVTIPNGQTLHLANGGLNAPIVNNGLLLLHGSVALGGALTTGASSIVRIEGINTYGGAFATFANGFTNTATIELTDAVAGYGSTLSVTNGTLVNAAGGTLSILQGSNGPRTLAAELNNQSSITIANTSGLTINRPGSAHTNSGTILVGGGGLTVTQSGTTPSFTNTATGSIAVTSTMTVGGGTLDLSAGATGGTGLLAVNNATLNFTTATMTAPLTMTNTTIAGGGITIPSGQTLTLANGTMSGAVVNQGVMLIHGAASMAGALTMANNSILRVEGINTYGGGSFTVANGFTNNGAIELTDQVAGYGATLSVTNGTLTNAVSGTITALQGSNGPRTLAAQLDNQGTVAIASTVGMTLNKSNSAHTNSGAINITTGPFTIAQGGAAPSFTNTGSIVVGAGHAWTITGGGPVTNSGTIQGPGPISLTGTLTNNGTFSTANATTAGQMNLTGNYGQSGAGSVLNIKLGGINAPQYDLLAATGTASLGGTLNVSLFNGFSAVAGHTFVIMTYAGNAVGNFGTINLPPGCTANPTNNQYQIVC